MQPPFKQKFSLQTFEILAMIMIIMLLFFMMMNISEEQPVRSRRLDRSPCGQAAQGLRLSAANEGGKCQDFLVIIFFQGNFKNLLSLYSKGFLLLMMLGLG